MVIHRLQTASGGGRWGGGYQITTKQARAGGCPTTEYQQLQREWGPAQSSSIVGAANSDRSTPTFSAARTRAAQLVVACFTQDTRKEDRQRAIRGALCFELRQDGLVAPRGVCSRRVGASDASVAPRLASPRGVRMVVVVDGIVDEGRASPQQLLADPKLQGPMLHPPMLRATHPVPAHGC